jgi:hypothetical protein
MSETDQNLEIETLKRMLTKPPKPHKAKEKVDGDKHPTTSGASNPKT